MEKGQMSSRASGATAPPASSLPTAPPSYEEAIGASMARSIPGQAVAVPPYPVAGVAMPTPYAPAAQMSRPGQHMTTQTPEASHVRVVHHHVTLALGPNPVKMSCPSCHADTKTTTMSDHQPSAHVCCIILCLLGCCLCSCLPYCLSAFLSVHHFCPNCKAYIGTWKG